MAKQIVAEPNFTATLPVHGCVEYSYKQTHDANHTTFLDFIPGRI